MLPQERVLYFPHGVHCILYACFWLRLETGESWQWPGESCQSSGSKVHTEASVSDAGCSMAFSRSLHVNMQTYLTKSISIDVNKKWGSDCTTVDTRTVLIALRELHRFLEDHLIKWNKCGTSRCTNAKSIIRQCYEWKHICSVRLHNKLNPGGVGEYVLSNGIGVYILCALPKLVGFPILLQRSCWRSRREPSQQKRILGLVRVQTYSTK